MSNGQMIEDIILAINCKRNVELVNRMGGTLMDVDSIMNKIREVSVNNNGGNLP
jgi:2-oxoisovalerate ferredoxin oxidoreductase alpha subunit